MATQAQTMTTEKPRRGRPPKVKTSKRGRPPKAEKTTKLTTKGKEAVKEVLLKSQLAYDGTKEQIDVNRFVLKITCCERGCQNHRYIMPGDKFHSKRCKPHQAERRLALRREKRAKTNGKNGRKN
jgi:hypothetical protein